MKKIHILIVVLVACLVMPVGIEAKKKKVDIYDLSLDDNLETPEINNDKHSARIQDYQ